MANHDKRDMSHQSRTAVVIPAYNEAASITSVLKGIQACQPGLTIIVVDDSSSDNTAEIARGLGVQVLQLCSNMGAWGAMQAGIRYARQCGFSHVITMDADGQHKPEGIAVLLSAAEQADIVIASYPLRGSPARKLAWHYFRRLTGLPVEDLTSGFRLYNARALQVLESRAATLLDFQDVGLLLMLKQYGLQFVEIESAMAEREDGHSRIFSSWWRVLSYMASTSLICFAKLFQRTPHKVILDNSGRIEKESTVKGANEQ